MNIFDQILDPGEFFTTQHKKDKIYLHHTAGGHRPDWTISGWNTDMTRAGNKRRVATAFVIGGKSRGGGNTDWDGKILRAFPESAWAVHLNGSELYHVDKSSIGIELCNYGPLTKNNNGDYFNYVNGKMRKNQVIEFEEEFRGFHHYHAYSEKQIDALKDLLIDLSNRFEIDLKLGLQQWIDKEKLAMPIPLTTLGQQKWLNDHGFVGADGERLVEDGIMGRNTQWAIESVGKSAFEFNAAAVGGAPGLWTHTNVRTDKFDCSPQPILKEMISSL